jgi:hypothetical protein
MMRFMVSAFLVTAVVGCHRGQNANAPAPPNEQPGAGTNKNPTPAQRAARSVPVLARTLSQQELDQLYKYMNQYHAEHGKYPSSMAELNELNVGRDLPKVAQAVESGDLVLVGGKGGILAYEKAAFDERGNVLTTDGVQIMTGTDLRKKLGG